MHQLNRRRFLKGSLLTAAAATMPSSMWAAASAIQDDVIPSEGIVDNNVHLSQWPFRRLRGDKPEEMVKLLKNHGVKQAWVANYDALLHRDIYTVNENLYQICQEYGDGMLVPFGAVNPKWPDWEEDLRRCAEEYNMPGIRLYPNYHQYTLNDPDFIRLLQEAEQYGLIVQIAVLMEDERTQHPLVMVDQVDVEPLVSIMEEFDELKVVIQNDRSGISGEVMTSLVETGQVYVDMSRKEGVGSVANLLDTVPLGRVLFGSHAPFFYYDAALLKMKESALSDQQKNAIYRENAERLLAMT